MCSNLAYSLLGNCLVEKFYPSLTFKQYVHKYILEPLGMTQTGFTSSSKLVHHYTCINFLLVYTMSCKYLYMHGFSYYSYYNICCAILANEQAIVLARVHKNEEYRTAHYTNGDNRWESNVTNT